MSQLVRNVYSIAVMHIQKGQVGSTAMLLQAGDDVTVIDSEGRSALLYAAEAGATEVRLPL